MNIDLRLGDCIEVLKTIPDNSVDSIVTDPPYGLEFMGKEWDSFIEGGGTGWKAGQMADTQSLPDGNSFKEKGFGKLPVYRGMNGKQKMTFQEFSFSWARECYRVLKPGGHLLAFGGSRMYHRLACGVEDAGFEIRDQIMWVYGSGFPKSHNIGKAIDKIEGNEREVIGQVERKDFTNYDGSMMSVDNRGKHIPIDVPVTKGNSDWEGWGTALKPAHEPIVMARKPLSKKSIAENVLKHGTGGLNIDGSRIEFEDTQNAATNPKFRKENNYKMPEPGQESNGAVSFTSSKNEYNTSGRFPANIIFDEEAGKLLDEQSGTSKTKPNKNYKHSNTETQSNTFTGRGTYTPREDEGGASRFFYCPKTSKKDRNEGLEQFTPKTDRQKGHGLDRICGNCGTSMLKPQDCKCEEPDWITPPKLNSHPTVKPTDLMRYLINLVTPQGGTTLDPFMGSGSTGKAAIRCGVNFIGIEKEQEYMDIAKARIEYEKNKPVQTKLL